MKASLSFVIVSALVLGCARVAHADLLYSDGPMNGTKGAYDLNSGGSSFSDSFALKTAANLTGVQAGLWVLSGTTPSSLQWSIGSTPFGSDVGSGTASLSNTFSNSVTLGGGAGTWDVFSSTFGFTGTVSPGTYWMTLSHGKAADGSNAYWDVNNGPSTAFVMFGGTNLVGPEGSSSFQITGNQVASTPEPSTLAMLALGGVTLGGFWRLRRQRPDAR